MVKRIVKAVLLIVLCISVSQPILSQRKSKPNRRQSMHQNPPAFEIKITQPETKVIKGSSTRQVNGRALPKRSQESLLKRAPEFKPSKDKGLKSWLPSGPKPGKRPGTEIKKPFPAVDKPVLRPEPPTITEDVTVTRSSPSGHVDMVKQVLVSFSQPMIPLQTLAEMKPVHHVNLTPTPEGKWRWLGVQSLAFESEHPFPRSSHYVVELSSQLQSIHGQPSADHDPAGSCMVILASFGSCLLGLNRTAKPLSLSSLYQAARSSEASSSSDTLTTGIFVLLNLARIFSMTFSWSIF